MRPGCKIVLIRELSEEVKQDCLASGDSYPVTDRVYHFRDYSPGCSEYITLEEIVNEKIYRFGAQIIEAAWLIDMFAEVIDYEDVSVDELINGCFEPVELTICEK